jgi:hypothetical protein
VGKRERDAAIFVAPGTTHPALFYDHAYIDAAKFNWIEGDMPVHIYIYIYIYIYYIDHEEFLLYIYI